LERFGRIAIKTLLWIIAIVLFLVVLIFGLIQVPAVQNFAKDKAVSFLEGKIHTRVKIGHITMGLPKMLVLENVYFEDQHRDTLFAGDRLEVDINMLKIFNHQVEVNAINLKGIAANIKRGPDSVFNFDYITKAFVTEQKKPVKPTDTTSAMKFSIDRINLDKINILYKDAISGNDVKFILGHFDTRIKDFDMDKMKFTIPKITLSGVDARIIQKPTEPTGAAIVTPDTTTKPINMTLNLGTIDVSTIKVDYQSNAMGAKVNLGKFLVEINKIDLKNQNVDIKNISLENTLAGITFAKPQTVQKAVVKTAKKLDTLVAKPQSAKGWKATLENISFANDNIDYDNNAQNPVKGLDFGHMHIRNLNADVQNLAYSPDTVSGKVNSFTFSEKSGLAIRKFNTSFFYGPHKAYLNDLYLETPQTVLQKRFEVDYQSIASLTKNLGALRINADLDGSRLGLKDVLLFMPTMAAMEPFKHSPNAVFRINAKVDGQVANLRIPKFEVTGLSGTHIDASAVMRGLPDMNKAYFDVTLKDFNTSRADINKLVAATMIPSSVSIPEKINLKGTFKGGIKNFNTNLTLRSSDGAADLVASLRMGKSKNSAIYNAHVKMSDLNVGALIKQPQTVGKLTLTATIAGAGLDPKTANLKFSGNVTSADVKGYIYKNLVMTGSANNGSYTAVARMKDPNINFSLDAKANMNKKYPSINATLNIDSVNLQKLHFASTDTRFHGKIVANVPTADPNYLNADIEATDLLYVSGTQRIRLDSVSLKSTATADSSTIRLKTPFLSAHMGGKYKLTEIAPALQDVSNKYFNTAVASTAAKKKQAYTPEQFNFDLQVSKTPFLTQFVPTLTQLQPVRINGHFNSQTGDLTINGSAPKVVYGAIIVNNLKLAVNTDNALNYSLTVDEVKASSSLNLLYTSITGTAQNDKLNVSVQVRDATRRERYRIAGVFSILPNEYQFSFLQNGLILNYDQWAVNADNALQFGGKGILAKDFTITYANQVLGVNSVTQTYNAPVNVNFNNFKIETLTRLAQQDSLQVGGVINGNAQISNLQKSAVFTAALNINDFNFKTDTVGNIAINVNNQTQNAFAAKVDITGKGNQVTLDGMYYTAPQSRFDLNLNVVNLNVKSIEGFSFGAIKEGTGAINGQLKISGTTDAPAVRGDINFNKVGFNVSMLNSYFSMPKESITFNNEGIRFNDFTLVDSTGNKAVVTGAVYTTDYKAYKFGMDINTTNFRMINSTQADNKLYYGKLYLDSKIQIRGDMNKPVVDATLSVNDKTDMTFVIPQDDPGIEDRKGVVEVINENAPRQDSILMAKKLDSLKKTSLSGLDVTATININKAAKFTIVVDERNGDVVQIQGEAHLNGGIDASGKTNLTGTYIVNSGSYNLSYATVSRKFNFKQGSTITWTGDPTSADINLTAIYIANVPPIDLVSQQLGGDVQTTTMYKQKLPFNVDLNLKNQLLKPDISFDIVLPDSSYSVSPVIVQTVNDRLSQVRQDPNEMNKQVLGVLILGHFIGDNPLQSQGGSTGVEGTIRNSVSSLLSDQLNKLAGNLIGGVQLSFDLTSGADYSTGVQQNRTDLNVGLSKQFLNDRVTVTVGNNFNLEGQNQPGQKTTEIAGNVSVNYKLTQDGRYLVRVYRRDEFIVVEGQVVETGVGFTITYEYNRFKELFAKKSKEEKALEKKYNQEQKEKKKQQKEDDKKHDAAVTELQPADQPRENKQTSN
jgi:hypothetical protein